MTDREQLAEYQTALLEALSAASSVEEANLQLQEIAVAANLQDSLGEIDPRMMDVAIQLTKKWGVRIPE